MAGIFKLRLLVPGDAAPADLSMTTEQQEFASALADLYQRHVANLSSGDVDRLLTFFTDDAVWRGLGWPDRHGKGDLRLLFDQVAGTAEVAFESLEAFVDGNVGWNFVDYHVAPKDASVAGWTFRTSFQFVREDDAWRCNGVLCFALQPDV